MLTRNKINPYPSIYVIGAQKSGTTTLYSWLNQDNRFQFPKIKETHFFSSNYHFGEKWYLNQFKKIDDYNPTGNLMYNDNILMNITDKFS